MKLAITTAKTNYLNTIINSKNRIQFYNYLQTYSKGNKQSSGIIYKNEFISDEKTIADKFNDYFCSIYNVQEWPILVN